MRIYKLVEDDFDRIIESAGGKRLTVDSGHENPPSAADYILDDAIIELKFVEEEGLEKQERQQKLADIFMTQFPGKPVVVLDPKLLGEKGRRDYYKAMSTPIQARLKKAARQLKQSAQEHEEKTKVVILLNVGYGSLYHEEFKELAINCATNVTRQIDCLIVGGIYFYSDGFESYVICPFEQIPINISRRFSGCDRLKKCWGEFLDDFMTSAILLNRDSHPGRWPVPEINFEIDGVKFVRPVPPMGKRSKFWVNGRPRINSTGLTECPPVAVIYPKLNRANWEKFTEGEWYDTAFKKSYRAWLEYASESRDKSNNELEPFIEMEITYDDFCRQYGDSGLSFIYACEYANKVFQERVIAVIETAKDQAETEIILPEYILLVAEEIGHDKANDLCSIYRVRRSLREESVDAIVENKKLFFEYGMALASAYAIKYSISSVIYQRDQTYMWQ